MLVLFIIILEPWLDVCAIAIWLSLEGGARQPLFGVFGEDSLEKEEIEG